MNAQRINRLYIEDGWAVRTKVRKKIARRARVPMSRATHPKEKWSMDFVAARLLGVAVLSFRPSRTPWTVR